MALSHCNAARCFVVLDFGVLWGGQSQPGGPFLWFAGSQRAARPQEPHGCVLGKDPDGPSSSRWCHGHRCPGSCFSACAKKSPPYPLPAPCFALSRISPVLWDSSKDKQAGQKQQPQNKAHSPRLHHTRAGSGCGWQGCSRRLRRCLMSRGVGRIAAACSTGRAGLCFLAPACSVFPFKHFQPGSICFLLPSAPVPVQFVDQSRTRWLTLKRFQNTGGTRPPRELAAEMTQLGAECSPGWAPDDAGPWWDPVPSPHGN